MARDEKIIDFKAPLQHMVICITLIMKESYFKLPFLIISKFKAIILNFSFL